MINVGIFRVLIKSFINVPKAQFIISISGNVSSGERLKLLIIFVRNMLVKVIIELMERLILLERIIKVMLMVMILRKVLLVRIL